MFIVLYLLDLAASMEKKNLDTVRSSSEVNKPNPNLKGLSDIGVAHENQLHDELHKSEIQHKDVGNERVYKYWSKKNEAENGRNQHHKEVLYHN